MKEYINYAANISWLAQGTRPDLSNTALKLEKKDNNVTIVDLRKVDQVIEKVKKQKNRILYGRIWPKGGCRQYA